MNLSHNETMSIRQKMSDVHLLMVPTNAMHRNGAYNCALLKWWENVFFVCSTNWSLYLSATFFQIIHSIDLTFHFTFTDKLRIVKAFDS